MKKHILIVTSLVALLLAGCAKAQTTWITDFDTALAESTKTKKDLLLVFTGSDWNDPSKSLIANVFTEDFFKKGSKKFILCNVDIMQDETLMAKELIDKNYLVATKFNIQSLPTFILQTPEGDVYSSSETNEQTATTDGFFAYLDTFKDARKKLVDLKKSIKASKGAERAKNIDLFIETIDPSRRDQYSALIREIPTLLTDNTEVDANGVPLKGKYELQVTYLDAAALYQAGTLPAAGDLFIKIAESGTLTAAQTQNAWYMAAYMYAMSETVDNAKVIAWLEKAIASDPGNPGTEQIKSTIEQIKIAPPKSTTTANAK